MRSFVVLVALLALAGLVIGQAVTASSGLPNNASLDAGLEIETVARAGAGADGEMLDRVGRAAVELDEESVRAANLPSVYLTFRAAARLEVDAFLLLLTNADIVSLTTGLADYQAAVAVAVANYTAQRATYIQDLTTDLASWKTDVAALQALIANFTASNGLNVLEKIKVTYDAWILHLRRRNIEAKVFLGRRYATIAELKYRYANAAIYLAQKRLASLQAASTFAAAAGNLTLIRDQLIDLNTEIKVREAELTVLLAVYARAVVRHTAAVVEVTANLIRFRNKAFRKLADIRQDIANAIKRAEIIDDIRRRVIAFLANVTDVTVTIDTTAIGNLPRVTITITKSKDGHDVVVFQAYLRDIIKRILVGIAAVDEGTVEVPPVPVPVRKRGLTSDTYTVTGTYSSATTAVLSAAAILVAAVARLL